MAESGDYGKDLQKLIMQGYRSTGMGDDSLGAALSAADQSGRGVGSACMVRGWRRGLSHMQVGALEVLLDHAAGHLDRILGPVVDGYGWGLHRVVVEEPVSPEVARREALEASAQLTAALAGGSSDEVVLRLTRAVCRAGRRLERAVGAAQEELPMGRAAK